MVGLGPALRARVPDARTVEVLYGPVAALVAERLALARSRPLVFGVQGPQGCGKSTLASALVGAFGDMGVRSATVSIDDFYLTRSDQMAVAERHPGNRLLTHRGAPGTHDVGLGRRVMRELSASSPTTVRVPVYDKSAFKGRGDRAPPAHWRTIEVPLDLLIVEGWMLGFSPAPPEAAARIDPDLVPINEFLQSYDDWPAQLDLFLSMEARALEDIVGWRVDSERNRRARGEVALSNEDARDYIERYIPAYRLYVPRLSTHPPCRDAHRIELGEDRLPAGPRVERLTHSR